MIIDNYSLYHTNLSALVLETACVCFIHDFIYFQVDPPTNKYLANLCYQLLLFQEDAFGKNKKSPPLTKIPHKCCVDFSPGKIQAFLSEN